MHANRIPTGRPPRARCARLGAALAAMLVLAPALETAGQSSPLARVTRLECRFTAVVTGDWEDDVTARASSAAAELEATFSQIDVQQGTAEAEARFGSSYIVVRQSGDYLHLIQMLDIGPVYVTTVMAQQSAAGRLMAVHTRHAFAASRYVEFRERPAMYVGDCAASSD